MLPSAALGRRQPPSHRGTLQPAGVATFRQRTPVWPPEMGLRRRNSFRGSGNASVAAQFHNPSGGPPGRVANQSWLCLAARIAAVHPLDRVLFHLSIAVLVRCRAVEVTVALAETQQPCIWAALPSSLTRLVLPPPCGRSTRRQGRSPLVAREFPQPLHRVPHLHGGTPSFQHQKHGAEAPLSFLLD